MKKINILITGLILISSNLKLFGQEDSVTIQNSTESIKQSDFKHKRKYQYLDNNFREEKTLIKIGTLPIDYINRNQDLAPLNDNFNLLFCFEKKITPSLSLFNIEGFRITNFRSGNDKYLYSDIGLRYYYTMNKRIKDSTGVNNFHGNYFSIKIEECVKSSVHTELGRFNFDPYLTLSWGIQRRLGKLGFIDAGPYLRFKRTKFEFGVNLLIGFGFGFKK